LNKEEKAYCRALEALRKKDYTTADKEFKICGQQYGKNQGFNIISQATKLLAYLRQRDGKLTKLETEIKESGTHGEETIVCGQGQQEKSF
jgi:outer membrane protein assembly factor BamD (BamD/ComL family)